MGMFYIFFKQSTYVTPIEIEYLSFGDILISFISTTIKHDYKKKNDSTYPVFLSNTIQIYESEMYMIVFFMFCGD